MASIAASPTFPLIVAQWALRNHWRRTEHWGLAALTSVDKGTMRVFQVAGNMDSFEFEACHHNTAERDFLGGVHVGNVSAADGELEKLEQRLRNINVKKGDPDWDCQSWVIDALQELRMAETGIVFAGMSERAIRAELEEEKEREETGHCLVHERLQENSI
ncbi:hypothetical protein CYLTODRAFT_241343 [Cylindrobasidium torrendii FP15055 ss-10]|uniref:Uncharacterized protein n=1 Tax=Cylindrobasidium torrendii FP15055 ss-10 TaxID=1314674 RepID=A0A0D7BSD8_9AGAR|nr:hypothetical protein CYLTODRAFT_241343 [Cylindrobasidium torrendii FP15055 ss-10]